MKKLDDTGNINPLITFFLVIVIFGLIYGIFNIMMTAVMNVDNTMGLMMWRAWIILTVIVFIVMVAWLLQQGQKSKYGMR